MQLSTNTSKKEVHQEENQYGQRDKSRQLVFKNLQRGVQQHEESQGLVT